MPLVRIVSSAETPVGADALLRKLSGLLARELGKPEAYVMTCLEPRARMTFAGTPAPTCLLEVKNVGTLSPEVTKRLSAALTDAVAPALGVAKDRVYVEFAEVRGHHWGFAGDTF
jgi:phenylpyruvate tautomerase PptA (4-oxalocrotonate tautomerase family)